MPRAHVILLLCTFAVSLVAAEYFDMSEGSPGVDTPCPPGDPHPGAWTEEDASLYPDPPEGPLDGKVLTSQFRSNSCLSTSQLFEVNEDAMFQLFVYMPETTIGDKTRKLQVWLVERNDSSYLITELKGPSVAKWHLVQVDLPSNPGPIYPNYFKVEIWTTDDVDFAAIRWFGVSDELLPPPETTDSPTTTEEDSTTDVETTAELETTTELEEEATVTT